jgi:hypothetical protein
MGVHRSSEKRSKQQFIENGTTDSARAPTQPPVSADLPNPMDWPLLSVGDFTPNSFQNEFCQFDGGRGRHNRGHNCRH